MEFDVIDNKVLDIIGRETANMKEMYFLYLSLAFCHYTGI